MRKKSWAIATTVAVLVGTAGFASPALADTKSGGRVSCGPGQQVRISAQLTTSGTLAFAWTSDQGGTEAYESGLSRTSHSVYTGRRAINTWSASSGRTISSAGAACS